MIRIGITGNAGSGKSTVIDFLRSQGMDGISADEVNQSCRKHSKFLALILGKSLKTSVSDSNDFIDSTKLREVIFSSKDKQQCVEIILHPVIMENISLQLSLLPQSDYCFIEIPLLYEAELCSYIDTILLITADREILAKRLSSRSKLTQREAESVLTNQLPDSIKFTHSNDIVLNSDTREALQSHLEHLYHGDS